MNPNETTGLKNTHALSGIGMAAAILAAGGIDCLGLAYAPPLTPPKSEHDHKKHNGKSRIGARTFSHAKFHRNKRKKAMAKASRKRNRCR